MKPRGLEWLLAAGLLVATASPARAQDATQQAKTLFDVGAQAYQAGNFQAAIQAFGEAYRLAPRAGILFSMAQAHRRQYFIGKRPEHLREALRAYREYVAKVEQGGRRAEAAQAIAELEPMAERLDKTPEASRPPPEVKPQTRVMVTSQTRDATIALDGARAVELPLIAEVKPGKHTLEVSAPGYFPEKREIQAADGGVVALDIPLRERPSVLTIAAGAGADVTIDGRLSGATPLAKPIELTPGSHLVSLTKGGHRAFAEEIDLGRGEARTLTVKLEQTPQRIASYMLIGVGAAGAVAGGVLAGFAVREQKLAQDIDAQREKGGLAEAKIADYDEHRAARDEYRRAAGIALGGALLVGGTGLLLFVFDRPGATAAPRRRDDAPKPAAPQPRDAPMEMSAVPLIGPGLYGASLSGRF